MTWRTVAWSVWLAVLAATVALSLLAAQHDTLPGDERIMAWAQARALPGETLSDAVRAITMTEVVLATGVVASIALWFGGYRVEAVLLLAGLAVMPFLQTGLKDVIDRPRPTDPPVDLRAGFSSESFPAGHVMSPTYLYGVLLGYAWIGAMPRVAREPVAVWSLLIIVLSAPPNVWLGVHWPSDVLGGWAWGLVLAVPVVLMAQRVRAAQT